MAKSKIIGVRIPDHLLREIENFGLTNFPKNESFDMTKSLLFLIQRGLQSEGIESPKSLSPSPSGDLDIDSNFKIHVLNDIENLKGLINDYQKQLKDNIDNLESQIDEFKESQIAINDRLYSKIENLETQSNQDVKPLIDENKQDDTPPPVTNEVEQETADQVDKGEGDPAVTELDEMETEKNRYQLSIELEQETADQVGTSQETDSPDPLVIEVNDSLLNTLTPDQQSVVTAIIEEKSENEIKSLIPTGKNQQYLRKLAKVLGFKKTSTMGINKLIPLMKNCLIIANK